MISLHLKPSDLIRLMVVGIASSGLAIAGCDTADDYETVTETTLDHQTVDDTPTSPGADDPYAPDPAVEGAVPGGRGISDQPDYSQTPGATPGATPEAMEEERAVAVIAATEGSEVQGELLFTTDVVADATQITGTLTGLEPGEHGLHVHMVGDCSGKNAEAAGEHFDPISETGTQAAAPGEYASGEADPVEPAADDETVAADEPAADEPAAAPDEAVPAEELQPGELGTIIANADGTATINLESEMSLVRGPNGIIGRAIVIHFSEDDDPVACGVIQADDQVAQAESGTI
jgi:Cu/Zn superoxide dismutase